MSRTYRRKKGHDQSEWETSYWVYENSGWLPRTLYRLPHPKDSKEYKKGKARYHSDALRQFKEPGPAWFRNLFVERPQRREAKRQLRKFMLDQDYEVILNGKDPLVYWT